MGDTPDDDVPVVGLVEIAELIGVSRRYVHTMRARHASYRAKSLAEGTYQPDDLLPEEDWIVSRTPLWRRDVIEAWARRTGRIQDAQ